MHTEILAVYTRSQVNFLDFAYNGFPFFPTKSTLRPRWQFFRLAGLRSAEPWKD
jgi:hypothetical protein